MQILQIGQASCRPLPFTFYLLPFGVLWSPKGTNSKVITLGLRLPALQDFFSPFSLRKQSDGFASVLRRCPNEQSETISSRR